MYGSEPSYSPYTQSPSPAGYGNPMTPGSIAPVSPAFNPLTPGTGMEETHAGGDWVTTDIEVRINENHEVSLVILTIYAQVTQALGHLCLSHSFAHVDNLTNVSRLYFEVRYVYTDGAEYIPKIVHHTGYIETYKQHIVDGHKQKSFAAVYKHFLKLMNTMLQHQRAF